MIPRPPSQAKLRLGEAATWGPRPAHISDSSDQGSPSLVSLGAAELDLVDHWINPNRDNARVGTVSVRLRKLIYPVCNVTRTRYGFFVHLPSMPMIDRDGMVLKDSNGKWRYKPAVEAVDKATANAFSNAVLQIIRQRFPEMLADSAR